MRRTKPKIYKEIEAERPRCERQAIFKDHICRGRSTMEHAMIFAGTQVADKWAVIRVCEWAHSTGQYAMNGGLDKEKNRYIALKHATEADLNHYPKAKWKELKIKLEKKWLKSI